MNGFQKYLVDEFAEDYEEGRISRRQALKLIGSVTGSLVIASSILAACIPVTGEQAEGTVGITPRVGVTSTTAAATAAQTETPQAAIPVAETPGAYGTVSPDDPAVQAEEVNFPGADGESLMGYLARPQGDGPFAVVLVCHENRGLTPHIQDVVRRLGKAGYVALAVDLLSRQGGTASVDAGEVPGVLGNTPPDTFVADFTSGYQYLQEQSYADTERVGMVGFCFGGGVTWLMATRMPELKAAVPFYGPPPPVTDVPTIQAAVLAIYGGNDTRINASIPAIEEAMAANGKTYEKVIYDGADHAFHNDTGDRYNPEAARDAWNRTLAWFSRYLV